MTLELVFEERTDRSGAVAEPAGADRFRLYTGDTCYVLPDVVLAGHGVGATVVQELGTHVRGATGALLETLGTWGLRPEQPVSGRHVVAKKWRIPLSDVPPGSTVDVTWTLRFTDPDDAPLPPPRTVTLEFQPPGTRPGTAPPGAADSAWEPIRRRGEMPQVVDFAGWVATVDFGTSSSTVTVRTGDRYEPQPHREWLDAFALGAARLLDQRQPPVPGLVDAVADRLQRRDVVAALSAAPGADLVLGVCDVLDRRAEVSSPEGDALLDALLDCYRRADASPPLVQTRLEPHRFGDNEHDSFAVDSAVTVRRTSGPPHRWLYLGTTPPDEEADDGAAEPTPEAGADDTPRVRIRDLKRRFARSGDTTGDAGGRLLPELDQGGKAPPIDQIMAGAYDFLVDHAERGVRRKRPFPDTPRFRRVAVTYPTTTSPAARQRLESLIVRGLGVDHVWTEVDEAVAAGLYFLMSDIGAVPELGAERFRARARLLPAAEGQRDRWEQTALVVDIGGGTTDIAVLKYTLVDTTAPPIGAHPDRVGRSYEIHPEVVGSTGHSMLGGHYLTLRMLYWLKAAITDALVRCDTLADFAAAMPDDRKKGGFADVVVGRSTPLHVAPEIVRDDLRSALPTDWSKSDSPDDEEGFNAFWAAAEDAKIRLSRGEIVRLDNGRITELIRQLRLDRRELIGSSFSKLWDGEANKRTLKPLPETVSVTLEPADFRRLMTPALATAARIAADLVQKVLTNDRATGLDRVLLTGQTSQLDLVGETIVAALGAVRLGDRRVDPPAPEVERDRPKQAASLGAAYALYNKEFGFGSDDRSINERGRTGIRIEVGGLHRALPNDFLVERFLGTEPLFRLGELFGELDATGRRGVRSPFELLTSETHEVWRDFGVERVAWSRFRIDEHVRRTGAPGWNRQVWGPGGSMHVMVELDQSCNPTLYFCNGGSPRFVAPEGLLFRPGAAHEDLEGPPRIVVATGSGAPDDRVASRLLTDGRLDRVSVPTPIRVHRTDDPEREAVRGWILPDLPAVSRRTGTYVFTVDVGGTSEELAPVRVPGAWGAGHRYRALVTADGRIQVFRGELPFVTASTIRICEDRPGSVLVVTPRGGSGTDSSDWDPFSGEH